MALRVNPRWGGDEMSHAYDFDAHVERQNATPHAFYGAAVRAVEDCTECESDVHGELDQYGFEPSDGRKHGKGWIHDACIPKALAKCLTPDEMFQLQRFVAALRVIDGTDEKLLLKIDLHPLMEGDLACTREACNETLANVLCSPKAYDAELIFVRIRDVVTAKIGLLGEAQRVGAHIFRSSFLMDAYHALREATHG
jgi:hypothetical protein